MVSSVLRAVFGRPHAVVRKEDDAAGQALYAHPVRTGRWSRLIAADSWLAAGFLAAAAVEAVVRYRHEPAALAIGLAGVPAFGCLALRRSRPLLALTIFTALGCVGSLARARWAPEAPADAAVPIFALLFFTYSLGAYGSRRALLAGALQPVALVLVVDLGQRSERPAVNALLFFAVFVVAVPVSAGRLVRGRTRLVAALREQAAELAAQRMAQTGATLAAERLRLAAELRSRLVVGMELLAAQVEAARSAADQRGEAIAGVEESARVLLAQTRNTVVALVDGAQDEARTEAPVAESPGPPMERAWRSAAQPWTVLSGGALGLGLLLEVGELPLRVPELLAVPACLVLALPLAMAWVRPLILITAVWAAAMLFSVFVAPLDTTLSGVGLSFVPPFVVAALEPRRWAVVGLGVCCLGELACFGPVALLDNVGIVGCCWLAGAILRERQCLVDRLHRNNAALEEGRLLAAQEAVLQERGRVARELHDAIGHSLTVVALQAGAARRIWRSDPATAETVLATIAEVTGTGLAELALGFEEDSEDGGPPTPEDVAALVERARAAGLPVNATLQEAADELCAAAGLAAYRVVQEALTNVLKHAPGAATDVVLHTRGRHVEVAVSNAPVPGTVQAEGHGQGLRGMRRRVEACGGQVYWGPRPDGGFEVRAELPVVLVTT